MNQKKYQHTIFGRWDNFHCLDIRSRESQLQIKIPKCQTLVLYSANELKKLRKQGFASEVGKEIMKRIQSHQSDFSSTKPILLFDEGKSLMAQAIWQHYLPFKEIYIYRNGIDGLLQEAEEVFKSKLNFITLYGKTGVGKSAMLELLRSKNHQVLHLEEIANHRGSTFGNLKKQTQPSQESFILQLAECLSDFDPQKPIFVESEKYSLGKNMIPYRLLDQISKGKRVQLQLSEDSRIQRLISDYAGINDKEIESGIEKLKFRIGPEKAEALKSELIKRNYAFVMRGLMSYFDQSDSYNQATTLSFDLILDFENPELAVLELLEKYG